MIRLRIDYLKAGNKTIIDDLELTSSKRSILITGGMGTGKTLLARAIAGDFEDSSWFSIKGSLEFGDWRTELPMPKNRTNRIGYIPQTAPAFFVCPSVETEIAIGNFCTANTDTEAKRRNENWSISSPLAGRRSLPPLSLSGGEQQLLMLEAVICTDPDHLVIDSGLVALDVAYREQALKLLEDWLNQNRGRRLVCFGYDSADNWSVILDFRTLHASKVPVSKNFSLSARQVEVAEEILRFSEIEAGPTIDGQSLLNGVSLILRTGEFIGLRGANGIGKSTLLRLVAGVHRPKSGEIFFRKRPIKDLNWEGLSNGIAYLPQEPELAGPSALSLSEDEGTEDPQITHEDAYWSNFFCFKWSGDSADYWTLSSGERVIAALIYLAAHRPSVWIFDEPTSRLEEDLVTAFIKALRERRPDVAGIVVSHDEQVLKICDRTVELTKQGII